MDRLKLTGGKEHELRGAGDEGPPDDAVEESLGLRVSRYLEAPEMPSESGMDRIGEHVVGVLRAAEDAAGKIQADARQEAARIVEEARREASDRAEAARHGVDAATAEAQRLRHEAEEWSTRTRESADAYSAERRADAESVAREIVSEAEQRAALVGEEAELRRQALKMDVALAEERLRQLASGLHELAHRLDDLLMPRSESESELQESLIDALAPDLEGDEAAAARREGGDGLDLA